MAGVVEREDARPAGMVVGAADRAVPVPLQGGFRAVGRRDAPRLVILYSSMDDPDWPDFIDVYTGVFTYFGDNKRPGHDLHDTPRGGNRLLQSSFAILHNAKDQRSKIPPFLVFTALNENPTDPPF